MARPLFCYLRRGLLAFDGFEAAAVELEKLGYVLLGLGSGCAAETGGTDSGTATPDVAATNLSRSSAMSSLRRAPRPRWSVRPCGKVSKRMLAERRGCDGWKRRPRWAGGAKRRVHLRARAFEFGQSGAAERPGQLTVLPEMSGFGRQMDLEGNVLTL